VDYPIFVCEMWRSNHWLKSNMREASVKIGPGDGMDLENATAAGRKRSGGRAYTGRAAKTRHAQYRAWYVRTKRSLRDFGRNAGRHKRRLRQIQLEWAQKSNPLSANVPRELRRPKISRRT
jgi:hypothetical protein